jgi:hypothetical protein
MTDLFPRRTAAVWAGAAALVVLSSLDAHAQLRVATWNISNYDDTTQSGTGNRTPALKTAIYGTFNGNRMAPDVFLGQEFHGQAAVNNFLQLLNTAPGSPGDWAAGTYHAGTTYETTESDSAFFYRTSKVNAPASSIIAQADGVDGQPRDTVRYDLTLKGYTGVAPALSIYSVHLKSSSSDNARRLVETQRIRDDAQTLGRPFLIGGDMNVQSSGQSAYQELVGSQSNNAGRFVDPINTPGDWNNNAAFSHVHTQDPNGAGGMDDRHDQVLLSTNLVNGKGFDYIGNAAQAMTSPTDPNHSYRAWGNDGTSYGNSLTVTNNTMVGPTIAQALKDVAINGGHLPIFLDLKAPGELTASTSTIDFGTVQQGSDATESFNVFNDVNTAIWGTGGIAELLYSMQASGSFSVPAGLFSDLAGGDVNGHLVTLDTSTMGLKTGTLSLFDDGVLARTISLQAIVVPEPSGVAMMSVVLVALAGRRRRR